MLKNSDEINSLHREEIIDACEKLYQKKSFKEITIKEISEATSFTRTSIYNYFHTKEEIFLALMQREYDLWITDLKRIVSEHETLGTDELSHEIACSLEKRKQLLKLLSMNHYDLEENSSPESLEKFKVSYGNSMKAVKSCIDKFCPYMPDSEKTSFIFTFFPFLFGVYPYTVVTEKQLIAMKNAKVDYVRYTIYEMIYNCVRKLLGNEK